MKTIPVQSHAAELDYAAARRLADAEAGRLLSEPLLLAWYDRALDFESPAHTSECHERCDVPGYVEYAESRGAEIKIDVDGGLFVFCYRALGEFAEE